MKVPALHGLVQKPVKRVYRDQGLNQTQPNHLQLSQTVRKWTFLTKLTDRPSSFMKIMLDYLAEISWSASGLIKGSNLGYKVSRAEQKFAT